MCAKRFASKAVCLAICLAASTMILRGARLAARIYTTADGLAGDVILCIVEDTHGYLWFCTNEGLSRFDGYQFLNFGAEQGLAGETHALIEIAGGEYWVASSKGVYRFNPGASGRSSMFKLYSVGGFSVNALARDGPDRVWCGTSGGGLYQIEPSGNTRRPNADQWSVRFVGIGIPTHTYDDSTVDDLLVDHDRVLWIASPSGLYRRFPDGSCQRYTARDGLFNDHVTSLLQDRQGILWAGTWEGLCRISAKRTAADSLPSRISIEKMGFQHQPVYSLLESSDRRFWVGGGLGLYESLSRDRRPRFQRHTLSGDRTARTIASLAEDHLGNVWIALTGVGAAQLPRRGFVNYSEDDGLAHLNIRSIIEDRQGTLCVVSYAPTGGDPARWVNWFDGQRFHAIRPNIPPYVKYSGWAWYQHIFQDRAGDWWVPTGDGVFRFGGFSDIGRLGTARPRPAFADTVPGVFRLFEDSRGDVWISAQFQGASHLIRWRRATGKFRRFSEVPLAQLATGFAEDRAGNVWIGFPSALGRFRGDRLELFGPAQGVPAGWVQALHLDFQGRLWIASGVGVTHIDSPDADVPTFVTIGTAQGLSSTHTRCITEDRWGRIYVGGVRGVDYFFPGPHMRVRHYSPVDGLPPGGIVVAFRDREGALWFGASGGLARLEPQPDQADPAPMVAITALHIRGEPRPISALGEAEISGLELRADQNQLQVGFVSPDLRPSNPLRYQYRLEGPNTDWSTPSTQRTVSFPSLPAGKYRFLVRAVTADDVVSVKPATVAFTILAPYWARWWFRTPALLMLFAAIYALYRVRLERLLEVEKLRVRIATDLHDDVGASLSRIAIMSEVLLRRAGAEQPELSEIAHGAREMLASMSDIVWAINPSHDHLRDLAQRMRRFASDVLSAQNIEFLFRAPDDQELKINADARRQIFLVFKEAVNNIARHSGCKHAYIDLERDRNNILLRIRDDGKGMGVAETVAGGGHGLPSMQARAAVMGGDVAITSQPGQGTSVTFRLPVAGSPRP
jgi:ligand-binding sensor domain-containing protein/signal transduction histidine kinase